MVMRFERRFVKPVARCSEEQQRLVQVVRDALLPRPEIVFAYIYGSFARGEPSRDLDVALYTREGQDTFAVLDLAVVLQEATGMDVDVTVMNTVPVAVQFAIFRDGQLLFCRDDVLRTTCMENTVWQYWDYVHFRNLFLGGSHARPE